jgi:hypothetical protein
VEVAVAVIQSLQGELSSNTVNAPMVPPEVLKKLAPFLTVATGLGKVAVQLVAETGFSGTPCLPDAAVSSRSLFSLCVALSPHWPRGSERWLSACDRD